MSGACAVSILVPICNVERYLGECLESLVCQTLDDLQIICIDDGSTDRSPEIIKEYARRDRRVEVITKPNSGYGDSMNKGLEIARGEYIGIVESDDLASPAMFEKLYGWAKRYDADVVKENFYAHRTNDPTENDEYVDNLMMGSYGSVQVPDSDDIRLAMYGRPAIWSGLYRRSFLEENDIRFLPTPGASFQDTSFNFKVLAYAKRAVFFPTAHLHYRIDNANSSVKSREKADFICMEFEEVRRVARDVDGSGSQLMKIVPQIQFGGYDWNLERLSEELRYPFFRRLVKEFGNYRSEGLLDESVFNPTAWSKLNEMLDNPDGYFTRTYGPIEVSKTCVLTVCDETVAHVGEAIPALTETLGEGCEILVDSYDCCQGISEEDFEAMRIENPNAFPVDRALDCSILKTIPADRLRGAVTVALSWRDPADDIAALAASCVCNPSSIVVSSNGSSAVSYDTSSLTSSRLPLSTLLLATPFYLIKEGVLERQGLDRGDIQALVSCDGAIVGDCLVGDYGKAQTMMKDFAGMFEHLAYSEAVCAKMLMSPVWGRLQAAYDFLPFDARKALGARISPETMPHFVFDASAAQATNDGDARERARITVIVPVYNSQDTIVESLESILCQTERSLQVICVDDGSSDDSLFVLEQLAAIDSRMLVVSQFNGGAGSARNAAVALARGEYLAFMDADDIYPSSTTLEMLYRAASEHNARICGGSFAMLEEGGRISHPYIGADRAYVFTEERFRDFVEDQYDYGWIRFVYHRSLFEEGIRFPELFWYEDPVFFMAMMKACPRYYAVPEDAYCYRASSQKLSWSTRQIRNLLEGVRNNLAFAEEQGYPALFSTIVLRLNYAYFDAIMDNLEDEEVFERLMEIQGDILKSRYREALLLRDCDCELRVFKELKDANNGNAIVRLARKVGNSFLYGALQAGAEGLQEGMKKVQRLRGRNFFEGEFF